MILAAVVVVAALALLVAFAILVTAGRRESADLSRFLEEKEAAWARIHAREESIDRREGGLIHREVEFLRRHADEVQRLRADHAAELRLVRSEAAAERAELLDRIQAPHMTAAKLLPSGDGAEPEFETDADVDRKYQERPEAAVSWDPDLVPHPFDLTPSDDVPPPTAEPVRP